MNYEIGSIEDHQHMRGWLCGQFFPENSILKTGNLEVKYSRMMPGDFEPEHFHPVGEEMLIIIEGKIRIVLDEKEHLLQTGDFVFEKAGTREVLAEVLEPTTFVAIRTPSIPDNKVAI